VVINIPSFEGSGAHAIKALATKEDNEAVVDHMKDKKEGEGGRKRKKTSTHQGCIAC
jgi:hypothetical protein